MTWSAIAYVMLPVLMGAVGAGHRHPEAFEDFITGKPLTIAQSAGLLKTFACVCSVMAAFMLGLYLSSSP